mgnify:CR=1 FL=1
MTAIEQKRKQINSFISYCYNSKGEQYKDATYKDISKVVCERYPTQDVEVIKVFFRSKGSNSNNIPFTFHEELPVGTAQQISNDLLEVRKTVVVGYGTTEANKHKESSKVDTSLTDDELEMMS